MSTTRLYLRGGPRDGEVRAHPDAPHELRFVAGPIGAARRLVVYRRDAVAYDRRTGNVAAFYTYRPPEADA